MLRELRVRDLGVLRDVAVPLGPGLNVCTGETGAGKTLLVTSLALLAGARAHARLVAAGAQAAVVEAVWEPDPVAQVLADRGIQPVGELIAVRRLGVDGRSRCWLDGTMVPVGVLAEVCGSMVEIHGQGAAFALANPSVQLAALDSLASTGELLDDYRAVLGERREASARLAHLVTSEAERLREIDYLSFQASEIERAGLRPTEDAEIDAEISRLEHAERLSADAARVVELIGTDGAGGGSAEAAKLLQAAAELDPSLAEVASRVAAVHAELDDAARDVRTYGEALEADPQRLEALRGRAAEIAALVRKHPSTLDDVIAAGRAARSRIAELEGSVAEAGAVAGRVDSLDSRLDELADEISRRRVVAAARMTDLVAAELGPLALPDARFEVVVTPGVDHSETGRDRVEFLFSSHTRRPPGPLGKVASGGELSRAMIAVTLVGAATHGVDVLVFDEADAGVGGAAALELGRRLARVARTHQVIVVTHLPQIAAFADRHIAVAKQDGEVAVEVLDRSGRRSEISRMLAGLGSSDTALAHADELLDLAGAESAATSPG